MSPVASEPFVVRRAGHGDVPFLRDMLHHAHYWRENALVGDDPPVSRYADAWGRPGDGGVILLEEFRPVGAAWYRLFPAASPGYGYVDEATPELSIAVVPSRRRRGTGSALLGALLDHAREDGFGAISLSVVRLSPALRLYERHGFVRVAERGDAWTMLRSDL